jgi:hypothetical protein
MLVCPLGNSRRNLARANSVHFYTLPLKEKDCTKKGSAGKIHGALEKEKRIGVARSYSMNVIRRYLNPVNLYNSINTAH